MSTNTAAADLQSVLRETLRDALVPGGGAMYAVDGLTPPLVATPRSVEQLAAALAAANEAGAAVIPWGGGRHIALGNVPARYDLALRTTKLDRVLEYEPADLTVTVEAGITMGKLQSLLAQHGQFLPIDPPAGRAGGPPDATVGGVLAPGLSGPSSHAYGLPRDWLLGCRLVQADGTVFKGGGRVVKNVAGYDLPKLAVGSLGTLGVIVEATFKVAPLPTAQETLLAAFPSLEAAAELVSAADQRGLALRAVALKATGAASALAVCWLAGPPAAVERSARELAELSAGADITRLSGGEAERWWAELGEVEVAPPWRGAALRAALPPSAAVGFMQRLASLGTESALNIDTLAYPSTGLVLARIAGGIPEQLEALIQAARRHAQQAGGSLVVTAAPVAVKQRVDVWGDAGPALDLMRRLKEQFDPRATLNPGRYVGGL